MRTLFFFAALALSTTAHAVNILSINTELGKGQRSVTGISVSEASIQAKADRDEITSYAELIRSSQADIVGLTETADKRLAEELTQTLGEKWALYLREDRNSTTGLRVSILSRLAPIEGSLSNHSDQYGYSRHEKHRSKPDAIIAAGFEQDGKRYYTVVSYLTAGEGDYADVRYAQADAIRNVLFNHCREEYDHCVLMGNMNDNPGSQAVKRVQGVDGMFGDKIALNQAKLQQGSGPMNTFGEGLKASQGDQIMSTLFGTASLFPLEKGFTKHKAVLLISREPLEKERPSKKIKRDRAKLATYYKVQHLQEVVEKQKTYIEVLEIEKANLQRLLDTNTK